MRLAVIADIHGNLPALEAVLAEVDAASVDLVVANGDLADGPFPAETLDRLLALGERCVALRGNSDRWLVESSEGRFEPRDDSTGALVAWSAARLTDRHLSFLAELPLTLGFDHPHLGCLGFCHASARSDDEMVLVDTALDHARDAWAALDGDILFVGHTHMPFDRLFDRRRVVNTGSVGMPYGHDGASWALVTRHGVTLRRSRIDAAEAARRIAATDMPGRDTFASDYVLRSFSDREALDAFRPIMMRQQAGPERH